MKLSEEYLQTLRDLPILQVARDLGLEIHMGRACCLWHPDKHPSLHFDVKRNVAHCFSCGAHAGTIALVMKARGCGFRDACQWLSENHSVATSPEELEQSCMKPQGKQYPPDVAFLTELVMHPYLNEEARHFLYDVRKIDPRVVKYCRLTSINSPMPCYRGGRAFYDAPSLLIPYYDVEGRLLSVQSRYLGVGTIPRFRFPRNSNCKIYNQQILPTLQGAEPLYVAEGCSDCWALLSAGHKAIAIPSATTLRGDELVALLTPFRDHWQGQLHIYPDQDEAGDALYRKLLGVATMMGVALVRHELPSGCKDVAEMHLKMMDGFEMI